MSRKEREWCVLTPYKFNIIEEILTTEALHGYELGKRIPDWQRKNKQSQSLSCT